MADHQGHPRTWSPHRGYDVLRSLVLQQIQTDKDFVFCQCENVRADLESVFSCYPFAGTGGLAHGDVDLHNDTASSRGKKKYNSAAVQTERSVCHPQAATAGTEGGTAVPQIAT